MSTPIERGAEAIAADFGHDPEQAEIYEDATRAAFESIDVDELARVLDPMAYDEPEAFPTYVQIARDQAEAVIAWLTSSTPDTSSDLKETR